MSTLAKAAFNIIRYDIDIEQLTAIALFCAIGLLSSLVATIYSPEATAAYPDIIWIVSP